MKTPVLAILFSLLLLSGGAYAKANKSTFGFQYSGLVYRSNSEAVAADEGQSGSDSNSSLSTTADDSYGWVTQGNWNFYLYPFNDEGTVGFSYMAAEMLEVGSNIGILNVEGDDKPARGHDVSISPFVTFYLPLGSCSLENYLSLDISQARSQEEGETPDELVTATDTRNGASVLLTLAVPVSKNFFYTPAIGYSFSSGRKKLGDAMIKTSGSELTITPISLRTTFD